MTNKIVLGCSPWLESAAADWALRDPTARLILIRVKLNDRYQFDPGFLGDVDPATQTAFVAWGPEYLNFQRLELFGELKKLGIKLPPLIHPSAQVSISATIQENAWIGALSAIGPDSKVGMNVTIGQGARLGVGCEVGRSAWIGQDVRLAHGAKIGAHTHLGDKVSVAAGIQIGKMARIETPDFIEVDMPDMSFSLRSSDLVGAIYSS